MNPNQAQIELYDVIIVGAGAAGCVLAGRLSEIPFKRILLIEAGSDAPAGREQADIRDPYHVSAGNARYFRGGLHAEAGADLGDGKPRRSAPYHQPMGVGGGSNVNGMFAERGVPSDYDEWRDLGAVGWGWTDVLPYFKKLERDIDFQGALHGKDGPLPIRRCKPDELAPYAKALGSSFTRMGAAVIADSNADFSDGVSCAPMNCLADRRVSASMAYLTERVRSRPNLTVLTDAEVERLVIRDGRVRGVEVRVDGEKLIFSAAETLVACGAVYSPTLLLRSGIGPAGQLRSLGIEVACDRKGVGRNLQNHPAILLATWLRRTGMQPLSQRAWQQNLLRYSSKVAGSAEHDMLMLVFGKLGWHALGRRMGGLAIIVNKAYSQGCIELQSADCAVAPRVRFNLLDDSRDFPRLTAGLRMALLALDDAEVRGQCNDVFTPNLAVGSRLAKRTTWNRLRAGLIAAVLNVSALRRLILRNGTLDVRSMIEDERAIRDYVRQHARAIFHPCGTCKMGGADDPDAVVAPDCRVHGIAGVRVVDASVFPTVPSAATHLPVIMVAEKMADQIKREWLESIEDRDGWQLAATGKLHAG